MILQVFSVYDTAAGAFGRPLFLPAIGVALRSFTDEVNRPGQDNAMHGHPADFILFHLGGYDDGNGRFSMMDVPVRLVTGADVKVIT